MHKGSPKCSQFSTPAPGSGNRRFTGRGSRTGKADWSGPGWLGWGAFRFLSFVSSFLLFSIVAVYESIRAVLALATLCISATDMGGSGVGCGIGVADVLFSPVYEERVCALSKICFRKWGGLRQNMDGGLNGESATQWKVGGCRDNMQYKVFQDFFNLLYDTS